MEKQCFLHSHFGEMRNPWVASVISILHYLIFHAAKFTETLRTVGTLKGMEKYVLAMVTV